MAQEKRIHPEQVGRYDQQRAAATAHLETLIECWRAHRADDHTRDAATSCLTRELIDLFGDDHVGFAVMLGLAIERICEP